MEHCIRDAGMMRVAGGHAVVFGATGAIGRHLVPELLDRGMTVRAVSRKIENLERDFGHLDVELHVADVGDRDAAVEAAAGSELLFHCIGLPLRSFERHPELAANAGAALEVHGASGVLVSSFWSYGPVDDVPVPEDRPPAPGSRICRIRRRQEEVFIEHGGAAALLPDFFGPGAEISPLNDALDSVARGRRVFWPGDPDAPRDFLYVPDAAAVLCDLAVSEEAGGRRWNVPGCGAETPRNLLERAAEIAGTRAKVTGGRRWMIRLAGLFVPEARGFHEVFDLYDAPAVLDGSRIRSLLGRMDTTPYDEALRATLDGVDGS